MTYTFQAGLRTLHGLGPQLRRAISGPLGSDDDELFLKEDDSQKAQVIKRQLIISFFNCNEISYSYFRQWHFLLIDFFSIRGSGRVWKMQFQYRRVTGNINIPVILNENSRNKIA